MNALVEPQANACLDLTEAQVILRNELAAISESLLAGGYYFRLIMTDDILHMADIRTRAKEGMSPNPSSKAKDNFFYGIALPDSLQTRVDSIVREHKSVLLDAIKHGGDLTNELGITFAFDKSQKAYLVQLKSCGMGFYISERIHTPRENRPKRMTLAEVAHSVGLQPQRAATKAPVAAAKKPSGNTSSEGSKRTPKQAPVKRRKFQVIRLHSS